MFRFLIALIFLISSPLASATAFQHIVSAKATTGTTASYRLGASTAAVNQVLQCSGTTSAGSGSATIKLQGSIDNSNWIDLATCSLTLGTSITTASTINLQNWVWYRINVSALSGTTATVDAWLSY